MTEIDMTLPSEALERDTRTADIFSVNPTVETSGAPPSSPYTVIARKYRPRRFEDLIGQEAMVRTLKNAFSCGRIAHAFMLTGVRGVGKTTTARLLARALNYEADGVDRPSVDLSMEGRHCASIIAGRNLNVIEVDAASQSKVDEMRELLSGVNTVPVGARYRVYIIDEVHMLSMNAFNALLKTLEEPPPHVKFIFATTEIRKVPVTILSRCQRFDLRRVDPAVIIKNLEMICRSEGALVDQEGLALIARAAEGSVRDAQSLLDQAILQTDRGQIVSGEVVRDMLGLADRSQTIGLLEDVMRGRAPEAIAAFRRLYDFGADPVVVALDLLEHAHGASLAKMLGPDALHLPSDQAARLTAMGSAASAGTLSRLWSMLLKAHDEVRRAPDPVAAVEMALIRLCFAASLPGPEEALQRLQGPGGSPSPGAGPAPGSRPGPEPGGGEPQGSRRASSGSSAPAKAQPNTNLRTAPQADAQVVLQSFQDLVKLIEDKRDVVLKLDVDRFVRLVDFKPGQITFATAEGAPSNLTQRLSGRLKEWTGRPWTLVIEGGGGGAETHYEREQRETQLLRDTMEQHPVVTALKAAFPGAEITGFRRPAAEGVRPEAGEDDDD
jgi:DNA polymerase-3 subunit gamma/tau